MNKSVLFFIGLLGGVGITILMLVALDVLNLSTQEETPTHENSIDTVYIEQKPEVIVERVVEKVDVLSTDTIMLLTNINQSVDSGDYVVLRDKLLHAQRVKIVRSSANAATSASDKLTERMSSDDFFSDQITVEFWESPIDYQGYRLNKTKLILFGINPNESFMLTQNAQGFLVMQTGDYTTTLQPTEKYRSFTFQ